jgi:hypothetical protein
MKAISENHLNRNISNVKMFKLQSVLLLIGINKSVTVCGSITTNIINCFQQHT